MEGVYLLLGSNEGDRRLLLQEAIRQIIAQCGPVVKVSALYQTAAWGLEDQPDFLNQAVCIDTPLSPEALLHETQHIEQLMGRQRIVKWGQRTLDIDILFYHNTVMDTPMLTIPHPMLHLRRFALEPLCEIAPGFVHPVRHKTVKELLDICPDQLVVRRIS